MLYFVIPLITIAAAATFCIWWLGADEFIDRIFDVIDLTLKIIADVWQLMTLPIKHKRAIQRSRAAGERTRQEILDYSQRRWRRR